MALDEFMELAIKDDEILLDFLLRAFNKIDEFLSKNDINAALTKLHECITEIKPFCGEVESK